MILFRRGNPADLTTSSMEIDVTLDLSPALAQRRYGQLGPWRPPIEVFETDSELVVRAELGGLRRSKVEVLLSEHELAIRGERTVDQPVSSCRYHESRVQYGPFEAVVRLPFPVAVESATANYSDGFLSVTLPRLAATRVTRRGNGRRAEAPRGDQ